METQKKNRKFIKWIILAVVVCALAAVFFWGRAKVQTEISEIRVTAETLKDSLHNVFSSVKDMNYKAAKKAVKQVDLSLEELDNKLDTPFWMAVSLMPEYKNDIKTARKLIAIMQLEGNDIFEELLQLIKKYPFSELRMTEKGLRVDIILAYLDFMDEAGPQIHKIANDLSKLSFTAVDLDIASYVEKIQTLFDSLDSLNRHKEFLRTFLGNGKDRLYLVMAQNTAEIRASGGFPGSMAVIRIKDGVLTIGNFSSVLNFLKMGNLPEANITSRETELFQYMYTKWSHDACYNPHFAKMAWITKTAYDYRNEEELDGVLSLTPEVIQKILAVTGETIELDDGTVLDGNNATRILQRDLYKRYQGDNATATDNNSYIDSLFAQTAKSALGLMFKNIDISRLSDYLEFVDEGCEKRTMMLWFADPAEEKLVVDLGYSGNLNADPENPVAGVYFSCCDAGKLGMFVAIATKVSAPVINEEGEKEYTVTVTLNNYMNTESTDSINSWYLLGSNAGSIQSYVYFFAPAGGTVSDFHSTNDTMVRLSDYENLQVGYVLNLFLKPGKPVAFTYKVTTKKGVETPLKIETTPTLQEYR